MASKSAAAAASTLAARRAGQPGRLMHARRPLRARQARSPQHGGHRSGSGSTVSHKKWRELGKQESEGIGGCRHSMRGNNKQDGC